MISKTERQNKGGGGRREQGGGRSGIIRGKSGGTSDEEPWTKQESQQTAAWHQLVKTVEKLSKNCQCPESHLKFSVAVGTNAQVRPSRPHTWKDKRSQSHQQI